MAEATTRMCLDCPAEIVIPPGRGQKPKRCDPCSTRNQKRRDAERWRLKQQAIEEARRLNPPTFVCLGCSNTFPRLNKGGPTPKRCPACSHRHILDRIAQRRHAATDARRPRRFRCQICSRTRPVRKRHGPIPRICRGCQLESRRRVARATYAQQVSPIRLSFVCPGCGQEFPLVRKGYSRRRCDPCALTHQNAHVAAWWKARPEQRQAKNRENKRRRRIARRDIRAERFADREIFDRDGWICGLCGEPVDRGTASPNGMTASLDHIIPLNRGGTHTRLNTRCAHILCNSRKTDRLDSEITHVFPYLAAQLTS
jgi:DNA-directed RNA polymerase subunit RPC12/RpoP